MRNGTPTYAAAGFATLFGQSTLTLTQNDQLPFWVAEAATLTAPAGPLGTVRNAAAFIVDPDGLSGYFALLFVMPNDQSSSCSVTFDYTASPAL